MRKTVKMRLKVKTSRNWANGQNIYQFENENNSRGYSDLVLVAIYMCMTFIVKQMYRLLVYISDLK